MEVNICRQRRGHLKVGYQSLIGKYISSCIRFVLGKP